MLNLMYITNDPAVARIAEAYGVDRIWVDMEFIGKTARQGGMDTVQLHHTIDDIRAIRAAVSKSEVLVRVNPIHEATADYGDSAWEIPAAIDAGADVVMLPFFKTVDEVQTFLRLADGRAKTMLLVETPEAVEIIDDILALDGIDEIHIGLNDLSLGYGMKFMFELLTDGTVERLCRKFREKGIPLRLRRHRRAGQGHAARRARHPRALPSRLHARDPLAQLLQHEPGHRSRRDRAHFPRRHGGDPRAGSRVRRALAGREGTSGRAARHGP